MIKLICFCFLVATINFSNGCNAQKGISQHYAFFRKISKGVNDRFNNTPVDTQEAQKNTTSKNLNSSDTTFLLFLETEAGANLSIDEVEVGEKVFTASASKVLQNPLHVGKAFDKEGKEIVITAKEKKQLWQIKLSGTKPQKVAKGKLREVSITGSVNHKTFQTNSPLKELEPQSRM